MKNGDIVSGLEITDATTEGKGLGRHEGLVIFTAGLVPGDVAEVEITKKKKSYAEAKLLNITKASEYRLEAPCAHFGICGGCKWQNLAYPEQLAFKSRQVAENLRKISGLEMPVARPILPSPDIYEYRNKLEFTFSEKRWLLKDENPEPGADLKGLGFHIPGRYDKVLDIGDCLLQAGISNVIRKEVKRLAAELAIPYYNLKLRSGLLRNLIIRTTSGGEVMTVLAVTDMTDEVKTLLEGMADIPGMTSMHYAINQKVNDSLADIEVNHCWGEEYITEKIGSLEFRIGPKTFFQTNSRQAVHLFNSVAEFAGLKGSEVVYDLYTGAGAIALYLASAARRVVGLEYLDAAIEDANVNAEINKITNAEFYTGDILALLSEEFYALHGRPDVIVTDPPRAGMHPGVVKAINASGASRLVYVSCNTATQARDIQLLSEVYEVKSLQPVDMFPHTSHVENVALLERKS